MRIAHFITSLTIGGAERALYNRLAHKNMQGHDHFIIYLYDGPIRFKIESLGIQTHQLSYSKLKYTPDILAKLISQIKTYQPDIIHTALWSANTLGRIAGKITGIPVISDLHGKSSHEGRFRNIIERQTYGLSHTLIAVSESVAQDYTKNILHYSKKKKSRLVTIPNGIDFQQISQSKSISRKSLGFDDNHFIIGAIGRLEPIKNYHLLINSLSDLRTFLPTKIMRNIRICLVGDGSERKKLELTIQELQLEDIVFFAGEQDNPHDWYPLFDCFTLSSFSEGLSIALLEALAHTIPIVTTNDTLKHDVITHQEHGLIVTEKKSEAFARALAKLITNQQLKKHMKKAIKKHIAQFDLGISLQKYNHLYKTICKKN